MTFLSPTFMFIFLPVALGIFAILPKHRRTDLIPVMGTVFFVCVNINDPFALVYVVTVAAAVIGAVALYKKTRKRRYLRMCGAVCFAFAAAILLMRIGTPFRVFRCSGIIMYLMAAVSLCLDVARGDGRIPRSLWDGVVYVTYFPVILAGPFVSYSDFLSRFDRQTLSVDSFSKGAVLFLKGFIKAVLIGSVLGDIFAGVLEFGSESIGLFTALLLGAVQSVSLYAFFSGYSDVARGVSCMLGIELDRDMGGPFTNPTPAAYLRGFFKGFSVFFRRYITAPIIGAMGENLLSRGISATLSAAFLLLLFCRNSESFLILLPFVAVTEYFVLFVRPLKKRRSAVKKLLGSILTFFVVGLGWAVVASDGLSDMAGFCGSVLSNDVFYISHSAADELLNIKFVIIPVIGAAVSWAGAYVLEKWDEKGCDTVGHTVFKCLTAALLLLSFAVGVILLLPQFPELSSDVFGVSFI